jgi:hypothetical protein
MIGDLRSFAFWFLILSMTCLVAPYAVGMPPRSRHDWLALALIIAFLSWLLPGLDFPLLSQ